MSQYWSQIVHELDPYVPGEQPKIVNLIKLNTNENPYGPSPKVLQVIEQGNRDTLRLYPDPNSDELKSAIADYYGIDRKQVFVGNGSDEVLAHAFQALLKHSKPLLYPDISYSFYPVYCGLYQVNSERVPLTQDYDIDLQDYRRPNGGVLFPNPNAPTGKLLTLDQISEFLESNSESVVVVDEAYIDFGGTSCIKLVNTYSNLLVVQTLSKSRSLAGLRVGFAVGAEPLIDGLERVKNSFNSYPIDRLASRGAIAAFEDAEYFNRTCKAIIATRTRMVTGLESLGFSVLPSKANFVFARHPENDALELSGKLREKSILVRHFKQKRIDQFLRITVGSESECSLLLEALRDILTSENGS
jgi:histidinol-phosphate aminotransferase